MQQVVSVLPDICRCARQLVRDVADADDLVQETCRRAIEARHTFAPGSSLRAWMLCILRNHHRDRIRRARREILLGDGIDALPAEVPEDACEWEIVSDRDATLALESLPPVFRTTYALHAIRGLSYLEIARRLGIPCATVGTRLRRARLRLRLILQSVGGQVPQSAGGQVPLRDPLQTAQRDAGAAKPHLRVLGNAHGSPDRFALSST